MGKDRNGKYIPPKGKPSGTAKDSTGLRSAFAVNDLETDNELTEKYLKGPDDPAPNVHMRHINRNVNKGDDGSDDQ